MASKPQSVYKQSDQNITRLRKMCEAGSTRALHTMLKWLNQKWVPSTSFKDYLKTEKKISMKAFNNVLKPHQRKALRRDPTGDTHDVSLLYVLIQWGNDGLADKADQVWYDKSECIEYLITAVKNVRNVLMHRYEPIEYNEFLDKTDTLQKLLKKMFNCAGTKYSHITQTDLDQTIQDLDILINKIKEDPLDAQDFDEYQEQLILPQQTAYVKKEGKNALQKCHNKYSSLTPVSRLANVNFPVNDVFTDMVLRGENETKYNLDLHYLLEKDDECNTEDMILIEGDAGVGKTTLVKKILSDWANNRVALVHLDTYDLVIHAECREHIDSFKGILTSLMTEVSKSFQGNDFQFVALSLNCLLIIDGFDELNKASTNLFTDVLQLKRSFDFTVIVTSRPEAITKYYKFVNAYQLKTRHIQLLGIPPEKREDFVEKYYLGMEKIGLGNHDITGLLKYLKRTEYRLSELWRLPYNLTILTILWAMNPDIINSITTAPELHWEIHQLYLTKLKERLLDNETTKNLSLSITERKVLQFIYALCQVSLKALANDDVTLPKVAYQQLMDTCNEAEIPVEEMAGAFLKRTTSNSGTRYSFPHKGLQDFLAALFIWIKLTAPRANLDIDKILGTIDNAVTKNNVPSEVSKIIIRLCKKELMKTNCQNTSEGTKKFDVEKVERDIESMMSTNSVPEKLSLDISRSVTERFNNYKSEASHSTQPRAPTKEDGIGEIIKEEIGQSGLDSIEKFQNMFTVLIGLFYKDESSSVKNETKLEALNFLRQTGVTSKNAWLQILNSVKCDNFVATYLSKEASILDEATTITDSTIFAYVSLLKALSPPMSDAHEIRISLDIKGDLSGVQELLDLVSNHHLRIRNIWVNDNNYKEYTEVFKSLIMPLKDPNTVNIFVKLEEGLLTTTDLMFQIKRNNFTIKRLQVKNTHKVIEENFEHFTTSLMSLPALPRNATKDSLALYVKGNIPSIITETLTEIKRNRFAVDIHLLDGFLNPTSISPMEDYLNEVFEICKVYNYTGAVTKGMVLSSGIHKLQVGIEDAQSYETLFTYLNSRYEFGGLRVCMSHHLAADLHLMETLPEHDGIIGTSIYITKISETTDVDNAVKLLKKLCPDSTRGFDQIVFPGASLSYELMSELLTKLTGLNVARSAEFPVSCKPHSTQQENDLEQLAIKALNCETGIEWDADNMEKWCEKEVRPTLMLPKFT